MTFLVSRLRYANKKDGRNDDVVIAYSTAWEDLGEAFLCGIKSNTKLESNEVFHICGNLPMGKYKPTKAGKLLGWYPKHNFSKFYTLDLLFIGLSLPLLSFLIPICITLSYYVE